MVNIFIYIIFYCKIYYCIKYMWLFVATTNRRICLSWNWWVYFPLVVVFADIIFFHAFGYRPWGYVYWSHSFTSSLSFSASCGKVFLQVLLKLPKELKRRDTAERNFYFVCSSPYLATSLFFLFVCINAFIQFKFTKFRLKNIPSQVYQIIVLFSV